MALTAKTGEGSQPRNQVWLNVGSGLHPGFINLDNSVYLRLAWLAPIGHWLFETEKAAALRIARDGQRDGALRQHDCRRRLPFSENSVDHILASHILEHVYPSQVSPILQDFFRVLRPSGTLHVIVPDLERLARRYLSDAELGGDAFVEATILSHRVRPSLRYRLLELLGYEGLQHRWMYDTRSMIELIERCGFRVHEVQDTPSSEVRKDCPESIHVLAQKAASPPSVDAA